MASAAAGMTAPQILDREFLELRAKILQLAASLDRIDRADGTVDGDPRMASLAEGLQTLITPERSNRAEAVQMIFSRPFDADWPRAFQLQIER